MFTAIPSRYVAVTSCIFRNIKNHFTLKTQLIKKDSDTCYIIICHLLKFLQ